MSKLIWTFELKQHTPLIHFQSTDEGVCLRATEVKPKFDRFLLKYANFTKDQKQQWFYHGENGSVSLKMKLRFKPKGSKEQMVRSYTYEKKLKKDIPKNGIDRINLLYFGNQGRKERESMKETVFYKAGIQGTVICFDGELLKWCGIKKVDSLFSRIS